MENNFVLALFYYLYVIYYNKWVLKDGCTWYVQHHEYLVNVNIGRNRKYKLKHEKLIHKIKFK